MRVYVIFLIAIVSLFSLARAEGEETQEEYVSILSKNDFEPEGKVASGKWIVKMYTPWCGYCKKLAPKFNEAAKLAKDDGCAISFGEIDVAEFRSIGARYNVRGVPTVKFFDNDVSPRKSKKFQGPTTVESIKQHACDFANTEN